MDRDGSIPHLLVFCIIRTVPTYCTRPGRVLLCHHRIAVHTHCSRFSHSHQHNKILLCFRLLKSWVDPFYSVEPILYHFRHIFLPVCLSAVVFVIWCSKMTLEQVRPSSHAPSATSNASSSCSRAVATSRRVEIHDAIIAEADLPSPDGYGSCPETSV